MLLVHPEEGGRGVVPGPEGDQIVLHEREDLGVQIFVAGEHLKGLVDQAIDVGQVIDGNLTLTLGLKQDEAGVRRSKKQMHQLFKWSIQTG